MNNLTRRQLASLLAASAFPAATPGQRVIDTHVHLFDDDRNRFPYHRNASYQPPAAPLSAYKEFVKQAKLVHTVIVHPEPYQDDHSYLEYCFANEPSPGYFKGTCLFDPIDPATPGRMKALAAKNAGRIVALRIHSNRKPNEAPTVSGTIRDRDLRHPQMRKTWAAVGETGMAVQMHFTPCWAKQIGELAAQFTQVPVILDHLGRSGQGTAAEFQDVLALAKYPKVVMKFSGWRYSSKQQHPFRDAKPVVRQAFDAFGPGRMIWGGVGMSMKDFAQNTEVFELMFDYAKEEERNAIRAGNAAKLFGFA